MAMLRHRELPWSMSDFKSGGKYKIVFAKYIFLKKTHEVTTTIPTSGPEKEFLKKRKIFRMCPQRFVPTGIRIFLKVRLQ